MKQERRGAICPQAWSTVPAAAEGLPKITRRAALGVAIASLSAAGGATAALAVPAEHGAPSWRSFASGPRRLTRRGNSPDDESQAARLATCYEIERRTAALPSTSAAEMAAKLLAFPSYGEWAGFDDDGALIAEARSLVGIA
jgi:hypothetical protein